MSRVNRHDIRAALILGSVAAAAGLARWYMDGSQADAAHLVSALQRPLDRLHSLPRLVFAGVIVAFGYFVWWLVLGRHRRAQPSTQAPHDRDKTTEG